MSVQLYEIFGGTFKKSLDVSPFQKQFMKGSQSQQFVLWIRTHNTLTADPRKL